MIDIVTSILVDLSDQKLYAHTHTGVVHEFVVSTGKASTPTPVMEDVIDNKHEVNDLYGPGYYIEDVKYIMNVFVWNMYYRIILLVKRIVNSL